MNKNSKLNKPCKLIGRYVKRYKVPQKSLLYYEFVLVIGLFTALQYQKRITEIKRQC